ncbi:MULTISPECIES: hypothetical protein [unclassified Marinobacterium]|uniref:hypothetical protein n=1 Tax=unclassified Marinobacterium TaxID=2644139 RepID=UPI001569A1EB|nr:MULTISPECIES: hypothetical protein [unclassified Marinobacterium]
MERSCEGREGWARNWTADDRLKPVTGVLNSLRSYGDWPSACHPLYPLAEILLKRWSGLAKAAMDLAEILYEALNDLQ